jgi:hypothetical protein
VSSTDAQPPFAGYDDLGERDLISTLFNHSQAELTAVEAYESSNKGREAVLNKLRYLRGHEPAPDYDSLSEAEVKDLLASADVTTVKRVRNYERKFANRPAVMEEAIRIQAGFHKSAPSEAPAYQPAKASTKPKRERP